MDILTGTYISACVIYNLLCYCISHPRNHQPCHLQPDDVPGQHILDLSVLTVANLHVPCHLCCLSLMTIARQRHLISATQRLYVRDSILQKHRWHHNPQVSPSDPLQHLVSVFNPKMSGSTMSFF